MSVPLHLVQNSVKKNFLQKFLFNHETAHLYSAINNININYKLYYKLYKYCSYIHLLRNGVKV